MEDISLLEQGLGLMGAGMSVVFMFLALMVVVMYASSSVLRKFDTIEPPPSGGGASKPSDELAEVAVAIAAVKSKIG